MKLTVKALILILICVLVFLIGCGTKEYSQYKEPGFNEDTLKEISLKTGEEVTLAGFKDGLEDFKSFSDEFFTIWLDHINSTSYLIDDFNGTTILEEKIRCSLILEQKFLEFKNNLENIEPPSIALKAYNLAVEAVSYRVLFFKMFNENAPANKLSEIENEAYLTEASFWEEIDNIYNYFDQEMERLKNEDGSIYNAASN
jgi:hypothetical protein